MDFYVQQNVINRYDDMITNKLPDSLVSQYQEENNSIKEFVHEILNDYFISYNTDNDVTFLSCVSSSKQRNLYRRRLYNFNTLKTNFDDDLHEFESYTAQTQTVKKINKQSPFYSALPAIEAGHMTVQECIERSHTSVSSWAIRAEQFCSPRSKSTWKISWCGLTDYPFIGLIKSNKPSFYKKLLEMDIIDYIIRLAQDIDKEMIFSPDTNAYGLYSAAKNMNSTSRKEFVSISPEIASDLLPRKIYASFNQGINLPIPGIRENTLANYLFTKGIKTYNGGDKIIVKGNLADIVSVLFPGHSSYSGKYYDMARDSIEILRNIVIKSKDGTTSYPLFEKFVTSWGAEKDDGIRSRAEYQAELGKYLFEDMLSHTYSIYFRDDYETIKGTEAKFFYQRFIGHRVYDLMVLKVPTRTYTLLELDLYAKSSARSKKERIRLITAAFDELKDHMIDDYEYDDSKKKSEQFIIRWKGLSDAEMKDFNISQVNPSPNLVDDII